MLAIEAISFKIAITTKTAATAPARLTEPYVMSHVDRRMNELASHVTPPMYCEPMTRLAMERAHAIPMLKMQMMTTATIGLECIFEYPIRL